MSVVSTVFNSTTVNQTQPLDIAGMIVKLSGTKQCSLVDRLKDVLSARLGDALDNKVNRFSGTYVVEDDGKGQSPDRIVKGIVLTSLKNSFLATPLNFEDEINNDFQNRYSKIAKGNSFTYTLESLRRTHAWKTNICTSTPHLDPLIQEALIAAVKADSEYVLGFELDMNETQKQNQLVFAVFEKEGEREISRVLIPESKL